MRPQRVYGFPAVLVIPRVPNMDYARTFPAQVTRQMSDRSQHSLQKQFRHVEPRKMNEAEKGRLKG